MSEAGLPEGWMMRSLAEVAEIVSGGTPATDNPSFWRGGTIPWVTPTDITKSGGRVLYESRDRITEKGLASCSARMLPVGTLLMTSRATVGEIKIAGTKVCTNQGFKSLVPNDPNDAWYLFYQLQLHKHQYAILGIGSTFLEVNKSDTEAFTIPYAPAPERQRIANILTTLDNLIEKTEALIAKDEAIKQGMMHDLFTRGLDEIGHLRLSYADAPELYKESEFGWIPREWKIVALDTVASIGGGITLGRKLSGSTVRSLPYIRVANVQDGFLDLSEIKTVEVHEGEVARYLLRDGDILLTEGGDFDKLGRGAVWRGEIDPCLHQNHIFRVTPEQDLLLSDYLAGLIASEYGKRYFLMSAKQTTNLATINSTQLKAFPVLLASKDEQLKIADRLRGMDEMLARQKALLEKYTPGRKPASCRIS